MSEIFVDGSGFNGYESKFCVVFADGKSEIKTFKANRSNNEMEYEAVIYALEKCDNNSIIRTDSQLVIHQVLGDWKVKQSHLLKLKARASNLIREKNATLRYIPRDKNLAGNLLE